MNKKVVCIVLLSFCCTCLIAAIILNYLDRDGWGWFLVASLCFLPSTDEKENSKSSCSFCKNTDCDSNNN